MPGDDAGLLVVTGGVASKLEDFSGEVLHDSRQIDGGTGADALCVVTLAKEAVNSPHRELEPCTGRARLGLRLDLAAFAASGHLGWDEIWRLERRSFAPESLSAIPH